MKTGLIFYFLFFTLTASYSQETLQVVTKKIEKRLEIGTTKTLRILTEKSDIEIIGWDKAEIKLELDLSTKHPDRAIASRDLACWKYNIDEAKNELLLENLLLCDKGKPLPQSNFKGRYVLYVPRKTKLDIKNSFSEISIQNIDNEIVINAEFCRMNLKNIRGAVSLGSSFGEGRVELAEGFLKITSERTDYKIIQQRGQCRIRANSGSFDIMADRSAVKFDIKAPKETIKFSSSLTLK